MVELLLAFLLFQVGLLATAGMVLLAQRTLTRAELVLRGSLEVARVADSLHQGGISGKGELPLAWGRVAWEPAPGAGGALSLTATDPNGADTVVRLTVWPRPCDTLLREASPGPDEGSGGDES